MDQISTLDIALMATGCSVRCRHCYASAKHRVPHPINAALAGALLDDIQPLIDRAERTIVDIYYDLFDHPDALGMIRLLHRRGLYGYFIGVPTNGSGLARRPDYRESLKEMHEMGSKHVQLVFHGLEENHDWFVRRRGAFRDVVAAAHAAREAGMELNLFAATNKRNVDELPALADYLAAQHLWVNDRVPFCIIGWAPSGYALETERLRIDAQEAERLRAHFKRAVLPGYRPEGEWWALATAGDHEPFAQGRPHCVRLILWGDRKVSDDEAGSLSLGNLRRDGLDTVLKRRAECKAREPAWLIRDEIWREGRSESLRFLAEKHGKSHGTRMYRTGAEAMCIWLARERQASREAPPGVADP